MRPIVLVAALLVAPYAVTLADDVDDQIREAVRLHDANDYQGAILIYRAILKEHPHHPKAVYEMAFSLRAAQGDKSQVLAFLENELDSGTAQYPALYILLGSAYDDVGDLGKGEAAFRRGLEAAPDLPDLHFNLGVNLAFQKRWSDAAASFVDAIARRPAHYRSWFELGRALQEDKRAPRAFFAYARAATLEPETERGQEAARLLWPLLFDGVKENGELDPTKASGSITITIPSTAGSEEAQEKDAQPDPAMMEAVMTSIVAANRFVEEWEKKSDAAFFAHALETVTAIASEMKMDDPFWNIVRPYFDEARSKKHLEPMAYVLRKAAGDPEAKRWLEANPKRADAYAEWARSYGK